MARAKKRIAVFPGSFDPVTRGHMDVIARGRRLFDRIIVAVGTNPEKAALFTPQERVEMLRRLVADWPDVRVDAYEGLTVDLAARAGAAAILRGIRNSFDLQHEFQVALTNRAATGIETVFILTSPELAFSSSSLIKQIATLGGDVSALVPPLVARRLREKGCPKKNRRQGRGA